MSISSYFLCIIRKIHRSIKGLFLFRAVWHPPGVFDIQLSDFSIWRLTWKSILLPPEISYTLRGNCYQADTDTVVAKHGGPCHTITRDGRCSTQVPFRRSLSTEHRCCTLSAVWQWRTCVARLLQRCESRGVSRCRNFTQSDYDSQTV